MKTNVDKSDFNFESQTYYSLGSSWCNGSYYNTYNSKLSEAKYGNGSTTQYSQKGSVWETNNINDSDYGVRSIIDSHLLQERYYQDYDDRNWFYDTLQEDWFYINVDNRVLSQEEFVKLKISSPVYCRYCGVDMDFEDCDCYQQALNLEQEVGLKDKEEGVLL